MAARQSDRPRQALLPRSRSSTSWSTWTRPASASTSSWSRTRPSSGSRCWPRSASGRQQSPVEVTLVAPADEAGVERRLEEAVRRLRDAGVEATGHLGDGDPFSAVMNAVHDEGAEEIIISTFPKTSSGWLRRDLVERSPQGDGTTGRARRRRAERGGGLRSRGGRRARARAPPAGRAPELARRRAPARHVPLHRLGDHALRVVLHRVLLRAGRQRARRVAAAPYELPVYLALLNTIILVSSSFTMHWALTSVKRANRAGLVAGLLLTFLLGLTFLLIQAREYTRLGFSPHDLAFGSTFYGLTGLHGAHVFVGLNLLALRPDPLRPRALRAGAARASRRRASGDLLALRRRDVDRGLRHRLRALRPERAR